jgi:WD40 repeat protein
VLRFLRVDGRTILVGGGDQLIHAWDATTGAELHPPFEDAARGSIGLPIATIDGRVVAVTEDAGFVGPDLRQWSVHDLVTGASIGRVTTGSSDYGSAAVVAEVAGRGVLLVGDGFDVVMVDLATGDRIGTPLTGHEAPVEGMVVVQSAGRTALITTSRDHSLRLWDLTARSSG